MVRFASLFDVKDRTVTFLGGKKYSVDTLRAMGAGDLLNSMFDFSEKLMNLGLSEEEMSLFTAVVLVSAGGNCLLIFKTKSNSESLMYATQSMLDFDYLQPQKSIPVIYIIKNSKEKCPLHQKDI